MSSSVHREQGERQRAGTLTQDTIKAQDKQCEVLFHRCSAVLHLSIQLFIHYILPVLLHRELSAHGAKVGGEGFEEIRVLASW